MSRVSDTTTKTNTTSSSTSQVSVQDMAEQLEISKKVAAQEKQRLEQQLAITNQQKQQLELEMQKSKLTDQQQADYQQLLQLQKEQTTALNNYNSILQSQSSSKTSTTSTTTTTSSEGEDEDTESVSEEDSSDENSSLSSDDEDSFDLSNVLVAGGIGAVGGALGGIAESLAAIPGPIGKIAGVVSKGIEIVEDIASGLAGFLSSGITDAVSQAVSHQGTIAARLYGLQDTTKSIDKQVNAYDTILQDIQSAGLFSSSFVSTKDLIAKIDEYATAGIIYNIEQRAFIGTISDQLVTTFNALEPTLTRLVRLQQSDMTMQFLGLEATLNENFTKWFADTSYLSDKYDSVTTSLIDAIATMNTDETIEFQYAVQKWLGALYSLGANTIVDTISQGINQLASGDIQGFTSNTTTMTLFTQAIARAGESLQDWMVGGLDAERIDTLMENIVGLLQDVVANTNGNNVTRSAYASQIYGVSISDLNAVYNLTQKDIANLTSSTMTATKSMEAWNTQVENYIMNRVNLAQRLDTVVDNVLFSFGKNIESNDAAYMGWYIADMLDDLGNSTIGEGLTGILGEALNIGEDAVNGAAAGIYLAEISEFGMDFVDNLTTALGNFVGTGGKADVEIFQRGFTKLVNSIFDWVDILDETRGTGFAVTQTSSGATETGISSSTTTNTTSTEALTQAIDTNFYTLASQAAQVAAETVQSSEQTTTNDANEIYNELFERQNTPIKVTLSTIDPIAMNSLKSELKNETIESIYTQLTDGVISTKSTDNIDAFTILSNIKTLV